MRNASHFAQVAKLKKEKDACKTELVTLRLAVAQVAQSLKIHDPKLGICPETTPGEIIEIADKHERGWNSLAAAVVDVIELELPSKIQTHTVARTWCVKCGQVFELGGNCMKRCADAT